MWRALLIVLACLPAPARACDLALALAVDVSGSVDPGEYRVQMDGLAAALTDGIVAEALIAARAQLLLVQWSGSSRQVVTLPWTQIADFDDLRGFAEAAATAPRAWRSFSTAIGEATSFTADQFAAVPTCKRRVIDVSGDGVSNEGPAPGGALAGLAAMGITVNALVIETDDADLTAYFWENVITGPGAFVETANGFDDYPRAIRRKLIRETARATADRGVPQVIPRQIKAIP